MDIGTFTRIGKITDLAELCQGSGHDLSPNTRGTVYLGKANGLDVVVKPYETAHERPVIQMLMGSSFSLCIDHNERYFVEEIIKNPYLEDTYKVGTISAEELGMNVGLFIGELHAKGINFSHTLEGHLFYDPRTKIKCTDFGDSRYTPNERRFPSKYVDDIIEVFEYLRDTTKDKDKKDLGIAIEGFKKGYASKWDESLIENAIDKHLGFADPEDPLRNVLMKSS